MLHNLQSIPFQTKCPAVEQQKPTIDFHEYIQINVFIQISTNQAFMKWTQKKSFG